MNDNDIENMIEIAEDLISLGIALVIVSSCIAIGFYFMLDSYVTTYYAMHH